MTTSKPRVRVAARALIVHDDHMLLIRGEDPDRVFHFLPGGIVKHGETLDAAAMREVKEETALDVIAVRMLALREFIAEKHERRTQGMPPSHHVIAALFLCELDPTLQSKAISELGQFSADRGAKGVKGIEWVKLEDVDELEIMPPHVKKLISERFSEPLQFWPED